MTSAELLCVNCEQPITQATGSITVGGRLVCWGCAHPTGRVDTS